MSDDRMSFEAACRELGISEAELEALVAAGEIASVKEGDTLFFKPDVVQKYKESREGEDTILLADEEIPLLEDDGEEIDLLALDDDDTGSVEIEPIAAEEPAAAEPVEISLDDEIEDVSLEAEEPVAEEPAAAESAEISLEDDDLVEIDLAGDDDLPEIDLGLDDDLETADVSAGDAAADESVDALLGGDSEETLLNMDGLLDEDSESTTPIAADLGDPDLLSGDLGDETLLDTEFDFGEETDTFEVDTVDDLAADLTEEATLLRGGGARVMQMKKKESHVAMSIVLALSALVLLAPMAVITSAGYLRVVAEKPDVVAELPQPDDHKWVADYNFLGGAIEGVADALKAE